MPEKLEIVTVGSPDKPPTQQLEELGREFRTKFEEVFERGRGAAAQVTVRTHDTDLIVRIDTRSHRRTIVVEVKNNALWVRSKDRLLTFPLRFLDWSAQMHERFFELRLSHQHPVSAPLLSLTTAAQRKPHETWKAVERVLEQATDPTQVVFVTRALNAIADLSQGVGESALTAAAASSSNVRVLLRALEEPSVSNALRTEDPLATAKLRGVEARELLLSAEGGVLSVEDVATHLRVSRQAVDKRRRAGRLLGVNLGRRGYAYPAWQFGPGGTLRGLEETLTALSESDTWMQVAFFLTDNTRLHGSTPLEQLRKGNLEAVLSAARAYAVHGAA
jgi:biotin operon repressor